jgi:hypothetical protein
MGKVVQLDAKLLAVTAEGLYLEPGKVIPDRQVLVYGGDVMVGGGHGLPRTRNRQSSFPQSVKGLGAGHLVDEVPVDVKDVRETFLPFHHMAVPHLVKQCFLTHVLLQKIKSFWFVGRLRGKNPLQQGFRVRVVKLWNVAF